jgi:hypothetical protein
MVGLAWISRLGAGRSADWLGGMDFQSETYLFG